MKPVGQAVILPFPEAYVARGQVEHVAAELSLQENAQFKTFVRKTVGEPVSQVGYVVAIGHAVVVIYHAVIVLIHELVVAWYLSVHDGH